MQTPSIGPLMLANPVLLAPMSGVTDAPFRRLVASLGAGLVVSEMTACVALAGSGHAAQRRMARRRIEDHGSGPHVVQLAGCEARWMAKGARIAEAAGADIIDINMGCPAKRVTGGQLGADARPRSCAHFDRGGRAGGTRAGDAEDAARLG